MYGSFSIRSTQKPGRAPAFTLIELLVVISIIAVLVSILLPSLSRARLQSQRVACASNQKQIQNGIAIYSSDQKGHIPYSVPYFNASLTWIAWQEFGVPPFPPKGWVHLGLLYGARQIRDPKIFFCPAYNEYPHVYPRGWNEFSIGGGIERRATAYVYAVGGEIRKYPKGQRTTARLDEFRKRESLFSCVFVGKVDKRQKSRVWPHRGGINAAFTDGSVQLARVEQALANTAAELYARNMIDEMDYFTYCFFRLLSGDAVWMRAYPNLPPGH